MDHFLRIFFINEGLQYVIEQRILLLISNIFTFWDLKRLLLNLLKLLSLLLLFIFHGSLSFHDRLLDIVNGARVVASSHRVIIIYMRHDFGTFYDAAGCTQQDHMLWWNLDLPNGPLYLVNAHEANRALVLIT